MRDDGQVTPAFWIGDTGKKLRGDVNAQGLAMYLMTSPHSTMTGVFHCPILYMAHETGLGMEGACKALARLLQEGFCEYDEASESVFVVRMASFQIAQSLKAGDKRILGLQREVEKMQPAVLRERFIATYSEAFKLGETGKNASPYQAPCKPLPSQEQEQEQEQELASPQAALPPATASPAKTGTRLPEDWTLPSEWRDWAIESRPDLDAEAVADSFRDFWVAKPGKDGRKADWQATWRNWVRNQKTAGSLFSAKSANATFAGAI